MDSLDLIPQKTGELLSRRVLALRGHDISGSRPNKSREEGLKRHNFEGGEGGGRDVGMSRASVPVNRTVHLFMDAGGCPRFAPYPN